MHVSKDSIWRRIRKILQIFLKTKQGRLAEHEQSSPGRVEFHVPCRRILSIGRVEFRALAEEIPTGQPAKKDPRSSLRVHQRRPSVAWRLHEIGQRGASQWIRKGNPHFQKRRTDICFHLLLCTAWPCLDTPKNQKLYKISRHIESYGTCMKY